MTLAFGSTVAAVCFALMILGAGFYEVLVVDPSWPERPEIIQPQHGGISRARFWMPAHTLLELSVIVAVIAAWTNREVRLWLFAALISHLVTRTWSFMDFIPKAIAFERAEPKSITVGSARRWTQRSRFRLPLEMVTCGAMIGALVRLVRG